LLGLKNLNPDTGASPAVVSFYRQKGVLLTVKADQSIDQLHTEIQEKLRRLGF
jgi:adenylate kinase family enzyme